MSQAISADYSKGFSDSLSAVASALKAIPVPQPTLVPAPPPTPPAPPAMQFGTNLEPNTPYQYSAPWCNFCNQMTVWYGVNGSAITTDANGYPASGHAETHAWWYNYPSGTATIIWKGPQTSIIVLGKTMTPAVQQADGSWKSTFPVSEGDYIAVQTPSGGVTSLQILVPDAVPGQSFRQAYINDLKSMGYKVLRFMDWCVPNWLEGVTPKPPMTWANRITPQQYDQVTHGPAYEYMLELATLVGAAAWLTTACLADASYLTGVANLFKGASPVTLPDGRVIPRLWWELGDEDWNTGAGFEANLINQTAMNNPAIAAAAQGNPAVAGAMLVADLTCQGGDLIRSIVGAGNVKVILGGQDGWDQFTRAALQRAPKGKIDAAAVGWYFNPDPWPASPTADSLNAACATNIQNVLIPGTKANLADAQAYGCELMTYEGGQSIEFGPADTWVPAVSRQSSSQQLAQFNSDPRTLAQDRPAMYRNYATAIKFLRGIGVTWCVHYNHVGYWGKWGYWGLKQNASDPDTAKSLALKDAIAGLF